MRSTAEKFYSKTDLAEYFGMPESTIRFYCERFSPYLEHRGQGRNRRYAKSCLEIIEFIRARMPELRTSLAMSQALSERFPLVAANPTLAKIREPNANQMLSNESATNNLTLQLFERQTKALESIAANLDRLNRQDLANLNITCPNELEALRSEIRDLRFLVKTTEKTQQEDMNQVHGLIMRLAKGK